MKSFVLSLLAMALCTQAFAQESKSINTDLSTVNWTGKKVTGKHTGTIDIKEGVLLFTNGKLSGGAIQIDMASMASTDLSGQTAEKLLGHLKSDDFFGTADHPIASLSINIVTYTDTGALIDGELEIKGTKAPISFNAQITDNQAKATLTVDRTLYGVRYGSGKFFDNLGDKAINDNFDLEVTLKY